MLDNIGLFTDKIRRGLRHLPYLPRGLKLVWAAAPVWTLTWLILLTVQGLLPAATVALTGMLVDSLVAVFDSGGTFETLRPAVVLAALMGLVMLLTQILSTATNWIRVAQSELVQDYVNAKVHHQSVALDLAFYDSADFYDRLHRARSEASYRPVELLENVGIVLQNGVSLLALAAVLLPYGVWLPLALVASTAPALVVTIQHNLRQHRWRLRTTADERRAWYYYWLLTARESAAEIRLFGLGERFQDSYRALRRRLRKERLALVRDQGRAEMLAGLIAVLVTGAAMAYMGWQALRGTSDLTLGDLAVFYQAFNQGQGVMRALLAGVGQVFIGSLFLGNLFEFLALEPHVLDPADPKNPPAPLREGVRFDGVTFLYPDAARPALDSFDLFLPAGRIAAIVGPNGAGKSTLIKLLCRLYDPQEGRILFDGIDLQSMEIDALRRLTTVLFQEPVRYYGTVTDNIALGDVASNEDRDAIVAAARAAGADQLISALPDGYDTDLGKLFSGGTDLSVGEWQRIALARAFLRDAPLIVLDEPTSAMDPWAEADWLRRFRGLARGRLAIIITHRFTTAMHADEIHVMVEGQIVEAGSHDELLAAGGRYAESWRDQMREVARG